MREYGTIDLETDPFLKGLIVRAFAGGIYVNGRYAYHWGDNCCRLIVQECVKHKGVLFYAHNGGKFDFHFLLEFLLEIFDASELELCCIGPRIVEIITPTCIFRDSFSLIPSKLSEFANKKEIDIKKLHVDLRDTYRGEILDYLKQDCIGLHTALGEFFETYGCELTLASTAFKILRNEFGLKPARTNEIYDNRFRPYYFSGRVQFWKLGKLGELDGVPRYQCADINSAFPAAMLQKHWFGSEYLELQTPPKKNRNQCFYEITCDSDGVLPIRGEDNSVNFPTCKQTRFFATGWELFAGLDLAKIRRVKYHRIFLPLALADFGPFVRKYYELKKNAQTESQRYFAKILLNAAYGKFGQDPRQFREVIITKCGEIPEPRLVPLRNLVKITDENRDSFLVEDGKVYKKVIWEHSYDDMKRGLTFWQLPTHDAQSKVPLSFYNVSTAASITGCVRAFLMRSIEGCKDVVYCDTDSIRAADISSLKIGAELGDWKLEEVSDALWIGGKKLYVAHVLDPKHKGTKKEWKTASKGVRLTVEDLKAVCEGEEKSYSFDAPNYSVFSPMNFTTRRVRRDDKRKRRIKPKCKTNR